MLTAVSEPVSVSRPSPILAFLKNMYNRFHIQNKRRFWKAFIFIFYQITGADVGDSFFNPVKAGHCTHYQDHTFLRWFRHHLSRRKVGRKFQYRKFRFEDFGKTKLLSLNHWNHPQWACKYSYLIFFIHPSFQKLSCSPRRVMKNKKNPSDVAAKSTVWK